jgi:linearmycin/streptolysin S transport system ATP-binding protein
MLQVRGLRKSFGPLRAVDGVSFEIGAGEIVGVLGPNGAGKTTAVSLIAGLLRADEGEVLIDGSAPRGDTDPAKRKLGLVPQELALYDELSARENLRFFGGLQGLSGAGLARSMAEALRLVGLQDRAAHRVATFSGGMKRRLNLAAGLLHDPAILLLDEPTVGVDPQSRNAIFDNLESLKRQGKALLYTTHYMEEAERLCDRIVIVDQGKVVAQDTLQGLYRSLPAANELRIELGSVLAEGAWLAEVRALAGVTSARIEGERLSVGMTSLSACAPGVLAWLSAHGHPYHHVHSERGNLEAVFLALTGKSLRDS